MNDWIDQALHIRRTWRPLVYWRFPDNDSIVIARGGGSQAGGGDSGAKHLRAGHGYPLLHDSILRNYSRTTVVSSRRSSKASACRIRRATPKATKTFDGGTKNLTVTAYSERKRDSVDRLIGLTSRLTGVRATTRHPARCKTSRVPLLITTMGAHYFIVDGEEFYDNFCDRAKIRNLSPLPVSSTALRRAPTVPAALTQIK